MTEVLQVALAGLLVGAALATVAVLRWRRPEAALPPVTQRPRGGDVPHLASAVLDLVDAGAVIVDPMDEVVLDNPTARTLGVVRGTRIAAEPVRILIGACRRTAARQESDLELVRDRFRRLTTTVHARAVPIGEGHIAVVVQDVSESRRVDAIRRDFVANVGHELKTPVGALAVLAEALGEASTDPAAVRRFAGRVQYESTRLGRLVQDLIQLSRLQGAEPASEPTIVSVDRLVAEVVDRARATADSREITITSGGPAGLAVLGDESQLIAALGNLVDNAIAYSPDRTRVAINVRAADDLVDISVSDEGMGIAEADLERVFERFYRADPARSRATGGTGLGLAIVKHVASNHGGAVSVRSQLGAGSTFRLRLPMAAEQVREASA